MSVKLGGYGSNRENARLSKYSRRPCRLLLRASSRGLKIASRCLSISESEAAGVRFNMRKFPATLATCDFAFFYRSFAEIKIRDGALSFGHEAGDGRRLRTGTQTRPQNFTQPVTGGEFHDIAEF